MTTAQRIRGMKLQTASSGPHWQDVPSGSISEATWLSIAEAIVDTSRTKTVTVDGIRYRLIP